MLRKPASSTAALIVCLLATAAGAAAGQEPRPRKYARTAATAQGSTKVIRRYVSEPVEIVEGLSSSEAQALVDAPISRNYLPRNFGPTDVGGKGTATGDGIPQVPSDLAIITTVYGGVGGFGGGRGGWIGGAGPAYGGVLGRGSWGGGWGGGWGGVVAGYGGYASPVGIRAAGYGWGYGPYQRSAGAYAGFSGIGGGPVGYPFGFNSGVYQPRYFAPYWYSPLRAGYGVYNPGFYYGNSYYGGYGAPGWTGYSGFGFPNSFASFGSFGYPYAYGVYGYPYYNYMRPTHAYLPSYAYFMYPGMGGLYSPPGYFGFPGYYGYAGYGMPLGNYGYGGAFYW